MLAESSLGGEVYATSEMVANMPLLRDFYGPFVDVSPGMLGLEEKEGHRGEVFGPSPSGDSTVVRKQGDGQRTLASGHGDYG